MQPPKEIVTLADIEEWFCELSRVEGDEKFASAARVIHNARVALTSAASELPLNFDHASVGMLILSPDAIKEQRKPSEPGPRPVKRLRW